MNKNGFFFTKKGNCKGYAQHNLQPTTMLNTNFAATKIQAIWRGHITREFGVLAWWLRDRRVYYHEECNHCSGPCDHENPYEYWCTVCDGDSDGNLYAGEYRLCRGCIHDRDYADVMSRETVEKIDLEIMMLG